MDDRCKTHESGVKALALDVPGTKQGGWAALHSSGEITVGDIQFDSTQSEAADYRRLWELLETLSPEIVILEIPFLYTIAQVTGLVKAWAAIHHRPWWAVSANVAKKKILNKGNARKPEVLIWAQQQLPGVSLTQHQADSLMYLETWRGCQNQDRGEC